VSERPYRTNAMIPHKKGPTEDEFYEYCGVRHRSPRAGWKHMEGKGWAGQIGLGFSGRAFLGWICVVREKKS
jgi:hypothetical protein